MMRKTIAIFVLIISLFLGGCQTSNSNGNQSNEQTYPIKIHDHLNREVVIEKQPERIVSGYYITTSLLIALDVDENLVGVESKAKSRPIYELSAPELLSLPDVGSAKDFNLETCISLNPDLVILPIKLKEVITSLEELGIPVIAVNPESEVLLNETILMVSKAVNKQAVGEALVKFSEDKVLELTSSLKSVQRKKVYLGGNSSVLTTAGGKMFQQTLFNYAHLDNVANVIKDLYWSDISYEQLISWNPDVFVISPMASYSIDDVLNDENLKELDAIKNKQVFKMPYTIEAWDSPIPSSILGAQWLASTIYQDEYPEQRYIDSVNHFYKTFYQFDPKIDDKK